MSRRNLDVSRERWDRLVRLVEKSGLLNPGNAQVLDELEKLAKKGLKADSRPSDAATQSAGADIQELTPSGFSQKGDERSQDSLKEIVDIVSPPTRPALASDSPPVEVITTGQASLRSFVAENWQQDYQERKLEFLLQNLALEERKQTFRERAFDALLDFKKDALRFQRERHRLPPVIDVRGSTKWRDADDDRAYREPDGWKNVK